MMVCVPQARVVSQSSAPAVLPAHTAVAAIISTSGQALVSVPSVCVDMYGGSGPLAGRLHGTIAAATLWWLWWHCEAVASSSGSCLVYKRWSCCICINIGCRIGLFGCRMA